MQQPEVRAERPGLRPEQPEARPERKDRAGQPEPRPAGSRALQNRQRILAVAQAELIRDPAATMDDIARAAGVVRRTLYGHFPSRDALIDGLSGLAGAEAHAALERSRRPHEAPDLALARALLAAFAVGDQWRLLMTVDECAGPQSDRGLVTALDPSLTFITDLLEQGRRQDLFSDHLPPAVLTRLLMSSVITLLQALNDGLLPTDGAAAATARACLVVVGVSPERAAALVREAAGG
ncbi:TetR family transcriptional regulator [Streptomyces sp. SCUT-3]|uniref:TetR/AcrR family transcriptional regulator n=1 Tax=Streptomyces TaxID=1883 RepID=UPI000CA818D6|nr:MULTISPECIES: TetR/AcrR family transcriptional regulator [unclassified Streptomyces]MCZ2523398.1 helix-turn-helix domain containing protein [Streptomyces sp. HB2AG]PLW66109.1 TetR family transcriptional regulator [Streptomyces sp. DJ]QMV23245.1 TetR family transcriptional regulator [Streptomyces sp. SCUT-3]